MLRMDNFEFSDSAHEIAKDEIYPEYFKKEKDELQFKTMRAYNTDATEAEKTLDFEFAIDVQVGVPTSFHNRLGQFFSGELKRTFQERFVREMNDCITITIRTGNGNAGELYKLPQVSAMLYGQFDGQTIHDWIIVEDMKQLVQEIINENVFYRTYTNSQTGATFISIPIKSLDENNIAYIRKNKNNFMH